MSHSSQLSAPQLKSCQNREMLANSGHIHLSRTHLCQVFVWRSRLCSVYLVHNDPAEPVTLVRHYRLSAAALPVFHTAHH